MTDDRAVLLARIEAWRSAGYTPIVADIVHVAKAHGIRAGLARADAHARPFRRLQKRESVPTAPTPLPRPVRASTPALRAWQRAVRAGVGGQRADTPSTWIHTPLLAAARWESASLQAEADGLHEWAQTCRLYAQEAIAAVASRGAA